MGTPRDDAGEIVRAYAAAQVATVRELGPAAAAGDDDAVHDARAATRRLRTALALCRPPLSTDDERFVRERLRDLGRTLGAARDPAVELAWLGLAAPGDATPALTRLAAGRRTARRLAIEHLRAVVGSPEHARLVATLDLAVAAPWPCDRRRLLRRVRRQWRQLDRAWRTAGKATPGPDRDAALHAARRRARRARYAAELVGRPARRSAARAQALQEALGVQHDAVLVRGSIDQAARLARLAGEDTAAYDGLRALAREAADHAETEAAAAAARALRRGHRRWLR